jgi:HB1, ASXL, restriction endonuclease HTH domain
MTYYEAALEVLRSAQHPLTTREITEQAIERGLIAPRARNPNNAMATELYVRGRSNPNLIRTGEPGKRWFKTRSVRWTLREGS